MPDMAFISLPQGIGVPIADTAMELGVRVTDTGILVITIWTRRRFCLCLRPLPTTSRNCHDRLCEGAIVAARGIACSLRNKRLRTCTLDSTSSAPYSYNYGYGGYSYNYGYAPGYHGYGVRRVARGVARRAYYRR